MTNKRKKVCPHCGRKLWLRDYYRLKSGGLSSWCKDCQKQNKRDWYDRNHRVPDGIRQDPATGRLMEHRGLSRHIFWNRQMLDDLRRLFPTTKNEDMSDMLGVSVRTLIRKARELGIKKDPQWQHSITMQHVKMAFFEARRLGHPSPIKKGMHFCPENEFKKGHKPSEEALRKQSEGLREYHRRHPLARYERTESLRKPVICMETGEVYPSIRVAAESNALSRSALSARLKTGHTVKGKTFRYVTNSNDQEQ